MSSCPEECFFADAGASSAEILCGKSSKGFNSALGDSTSYEHDVIAMSQSPNALDLTMNNSRGMQSRVADSRVDHIIFCYSVSPRGSVHPD